MTKTNDTRLADLGHDAQRRAALYHVLLRRIVTEVDRYMERCPVCRTHASEPHTDECMILLASQALDADNDAIRAMLARVSED